MIVDVLLREIDVVPREILRGLRPLRMTAFSGIGWRALLAWAAGAAVPTWFCGLEGYDYYGDCGQS
jgi:hypothetical protein